MKAESFSWDLRECLVIDLTSIHTHTLTHIGISTVYARFKFVEKKNEYTPRVVGPRLNTAALVLGLISCLGMVVVATFQVPQTSMC